ncbi:MAG: hypothetical protein Q4E88_00155 [Coriobacteriia bacterium]|nr:hypothetical protein [Coriobacteriia bacterium]
MSYKSKFVVSHVSAFLILRIARGYNASIQKSNISLSNTRKPKSNEITKIKELIFFIYKKQLKIDCLCFDTNKRCKLQSVKNHVVQTDIPQKSFVSITTNNTKLQELIFDHIVIPSPALLFLQLCETFSVYDAMLFGMELCGTYTIAGPKDDHKLINVLQYTTARAIKQGISCLKGKHIKGIKKAIIASKTINDNSASPAESKLYLMLCGPRYLGAYQIKKFSLNKAILPSYQAQNISGQKRIKPDMCNSHYKVAIEYDSKKYHENVVQSQKDKRRKDALLYDKWKVYTIVPAQIRNRYIMNSIANKLLIACKQEPRIYAKNFCKKQNALFTAFFDRDAI